MNLFIIQKQNISLLVFVYLKFWASVDETASLPDINDVLTL